MWLGAEFDYDQDAGIFEHFISYLCEHHPEILPFLKVKNTNEIILSSGIRQGHNLAVLEFFWGEITLFFGYTHIHYPIEEMPRDFITVFEELKEFLVGDNYSVLYLQRTTNEERVLYAIDGVYYSYAGGTTMRAGDLEEVKKRIHEEYGGELLYALVENVRGGIDVLLEVTNKGVKILKTIPVDEHKIHVKDIFGKEGPFTVLGRYLCGSINEEELYSALSKEEVEMIKEEARDLCNSYGFGIFDGDPTD